MHSYFNPFTLLAIVVSLIAGCGQKPAGQFSKALGVAVRTEKVQQVDLATLTPLVWDELYAFGPYSKREDNCRTLQLGWFWCRYYLPAGVNESEYILVFRSQSKITHVEHHWRFNGDLDSRGAKWYPGPIKRSDAKFSVSLVSNRAPVEERWYSLEHQPLR